MNQLKVQVDTSQVDETQEKIEKFIALVKEANSLADELAHKEIKISISTNETN
ncbi:hypothetical protein [Ornithinibacillus sp. JPR2-1]|uniref:hypothetical protein n=1 Tax=Ornithinibacillus sp. JPR2-1 TaxID=2094019 RepID=UPI0031D7A33B